MTSTSKPTGCYKCGKSDHWSRDCPSRPSSENQAPGSSAAASSSAFGLPQATPQSGVAQGGFQRWQGSSSQGNKRKEPWPGSSFSAKEKPVKVPVPPRRMPKLTPDLLLGADGLGYVLEKIPRQVSIKGRGHEVEDLKSLLEAYIRWHQTLLPYYSYSQFVEKVEKVGSSKRVRLCVRELRQKIEKGEKLSIADVNAVAESDDSPAEHAEELVRRYETDNDEAEDRADPPMDVLEEHLRDTVPVLETASAPNTRPVFVLGKDTITVIPPEIKEEQRARMEANKQKAIERARARKLELEQAESTAPP